MLFLMSWLPPPLAAVTIAVAHAAVLLDIAIRRDLPWWRRLVTGVMVGAFVLPLGALAYLLVRPVGARMRRRIARRHAALAAKGWVAPSGWRRTLARGASVAGVTIALAASAAASAVAAPTSPFAGENYGIAFMSGTVGAAN